MLWKFSPCFFPLLPTQTLYNTRNYTFSLFPAGQYPIALWEYTLPWKIFCSFAMGDLWRLLYFSVSFNSLMFSKICPIFCPRNKNCLGVVGEKENQRKQLWLKDTECLHVVWKDRRLLKPWSKEICWSLTYCSPCLPCPPLVSGYSRWENACNYNDLSPALEEVTGHRSVHQLTFPSPIHIHPLTK